jgi:hypothetical protein
MNIEEFRQREKAFTVTPEDVVGNTSKDVVGHNNVSFDNQGSYVRVSHAEYDEKAGFDLTDFDNVKNFTEALEDVGIAISRLLSCTEGDRVRKNNLSVLLGK